MSRAALLLLLAGCGEPERATPTPALETTAVEVPLASDAMAGRSWRRMNIDQLKASIEAVTGGIGWTEVQDGEEVDLFVALDGTMGKPDFLSATEEDLVPGLLFQKFLEDAATSACTRLMEVEPGRAAADRALLVAAELEDTPDTAPAAIEANLAAALLRFHGRAVSPGDPALAPWIRLVDGVYALDGDMSAAWRAVCVGLITHPDFYRY